MATAPMLTSSAATAEPFETPEQYQDAIVLLRAAAHAYYGGTQLEMDDARYDQLVARVAATETHHSQWKATDSPTETVGAVGGDVAHTSPMLSLDNVFDQAELRAWAQRLTRTLGRTVRGYAVEPKVDGMAVAAQYVDGHLMRVITRGDGRTGEDVTVQARAIAGLPTQLARPVTVEIRGEVYMSDLDFARANQLRTGHGGTPFANPRNATVGTLRTKDRPYAAPLSFLAYAAHGLASAARLPHSQLMARIAALGVAITADSPAGLAVCATVDEAFAAVMQLADSRDAIGYAVDGAVIKAEQPADRDDAGASSRAPRWAIAYKFPPDTRTTVLRGIEVQIGRTGILTPVAVLDPVAVGGVEISSATLHNFADLAQRDVRIDDTVWVRRAGEVIPEITGPRLDLRHPEAQPFSPPTACPRCGADIDRSEKRWRCIRGRACGTAEALHYYAARDSMDIEGLGDKVIAALVTAGLATDPADLYDLEAASIARLDGLGAASAAKLVSNIQASKAQPLARVLTGLGVRKTGRSMSRRLTRHFGSMTALCTATVQQLQQVEGVGPEKAAAIAEDLAELAPVIAKLAERGVTMSDTATDFTPAVSRPLRKTDGTPMAVVVTGTVPGLSRTGANEAVETLGGAASNSVSRRTNLVVAGAGAGSKAAKADQLGVPVLSADWFAALLAAFTDGDSTAVGQLLAAIPGS